MEQKFCQSCGMPLTEEVLGTDADIFHHHTPRHCGCIATFAAVQEGRVLARAEASFTI